MSDNVLLPVAIVAVITLAAMILVIVLGTVAVTRVKYTCSPTPQAQQIERPAGQRCGRTC